MKALKIESITLYDYSIQLRVPFRISAGEITTKEAVILEMRSGDFIGWGEAAVDAVPFYAHETVGSVLDVMKRALIPAVRGKSFATPEELSDYMEKAYRGNNFAKAAVEAAFWDVYGKSLGKSCAALLGATREVIESGPSLGIKTEPAALVDAVTEQVLLGRRRIKIKVTPGKDLQYLEAVRKAYPDICLMVDANNAYSREDFAHLQKFDAFSLLMIEQPLYETDVYYHSLLRKQMRTPICLDESIHTVHDAHCAVALQAADIINIKVCRVGGLVNTLRIHDICQKAGIGNWIGSRIGTGVAVAPRVCAAALPNCIYPSDCGLENTLYMPDDIVEPTEVIDGCFRKVPLTSGLGLNVDREKLRHYTVSSEAFR